MKNWPYIALFLWGILIALLLFRKPEIQPPKIEYRYDTVWVDVPVDVPVPYKVVCIHTDTIYKYITDTVLTDVDTAAILASYFAVLTYNDTIRDSQIAIYLQEKVSQNRIISRDLAYKWKLPTEIHTTFSNYIYAGLTGIYSPDGLQAFINLNYAGPKWTGWAGYDPLNRSIMIGAGYRLIKW